MCVYTYIYIYNHDENHLKIIEYSSDDSRFTQVTKRPGTVPSSPSTRPVDPRQIWASSIRRCGRLVALHPPQ